MELIYLALKTTQVHGEIQEIALIASTTSSSGKMSPVLTSRQRASRQKWSSKWMKTAAVMAAIASSQLVPSVSATDPSVPIGGMVPHLLEHGNTTSSFVSSASMIATTADSQATLQASKQQKTNASEAVLSAFSEDGTPHSSLVNEAVSLAGTNAGTKTDDPSDKSAGYTRKAEQTRTSSKQQPTGSKSKPASSGENRAAFPAVSSKSDFTSSTYAATSSSASQASSTPTPAERTANWHYWGGALGCDQGSASGTAYVCHATGVPEPPNAKRQEAEERAVEMDDEMFENMMEKRQSSDGNDPSGNGGPPLDILNKDSPDVGWLDVIVGAVPYKNGDLAPSIVWILATLVLFPLFVIRLFRRSSLIAHVLLTVFIWGCVMIATFAIRASLANKTPKTTLMSVQNITLQILPCLLIEPLLNLLALYAQQGGFPTGVPRVALFLRFLNLVALLLYIIGAAYLATWLSQWDAALQDNQQIGDRSNFPNSEPDSISRIGPIAGSFMQVICILGALILIPIARGENGSMRPGGFIAVLVILITIPVVYRVLQTLHAQGEINSENGGDANPFKVLAVNGATMSSAAMNAVMNLVPVAAIAPPGMYNSDVSGIDWAQLQQTLASRSNIQSPLVFNLVYIFPQWLMVFFFFFVHAPGRENDGKLAAASAQP